MKKIVILAMLLFMGMVNANPIIIPAHICLKSTPVTMLDKITKLGKDRVHSNIVQCPDGKSSCPDGQTCCSNAAGGYSCCPAPRATCCSDKVHCCPNSFSCQPDPSGGYNCVK